MNIFDIPYLNSYKPRFSMREANAILQAVRNLYGVYTAQRSSISTSGISLQQTKNRETTISVMFDATYDPYSIFAVALTSSSPFFEITQPIQAVLLNPNRDSINRNEDTIYCTNSDFIGTSGSTIPCDIIGYTKPHLITYSGTDPDIGDKCYPVPGQKYVTKNENGPFLVVSKPETTRKLVWIVRHERVMKIHGTADADINYGSDGTISIFRDLTDSGDSATVSFKFLGETGDVIASGTKVEAEWRDDLNNGVGGWLVVAVNCPAA